MKRYSVIYADPPWQYRTKRGRGAAEKHYPTMAAQELRALPVVKLADKDAVLFLWATFPQLEEALELIQAWGFSYKTCAFVWVKLNRRSQGLFWGLGNWTRANAELCLMAVKGRPRRLARKCTSDHYIPGGRAQQKAGGGPAAHRSSDG